MNYDFPEIRNITDVLPAIGTDKEFVVARKDDYTIVNYLVTTNTTFPPVDSEAAAIRRECRGIAFNNENGDIISRPFHKFFNYGEKEETSNLDPHTPHTLLRKLDGSMIRPLYFGGEKNFRLATKMGITDIAMQAERHICDKKWYLDFIAKCKEYGLTPIFEWCSKGNQIVLDYPESKLILLAVRDMVTGEYHSHNSLLAVSGGFGVPVVDVFNFDGNLEEAVAHTRAEEGNEGYVAVYQNGHRLKMKSDWYVRLHKSKELVSREKDLIKLILENQLDDVIPSLTLEDKKKVEHFQNTLTCGMKEAAGFIEKEFNQVKTWLEEETQKNNYASDSKEHRKIFAKLVKDHIKPKFHWFMFKLYENDNSLELVKKMLLASTSSATKVDENRWLMNYCKYEGWANAA